MCRTFIFFLTPCVSSVLSVPVAEPPALLAASLGTARCSPGNQEVPRVLLPCRGALRHPCSSISLGGGAPRRGFAAPSPHFQVLQKVSATGCPSIPNPGLCNVLCAMPNRLRISVLVCCQLNNSSQKDKTIRAASPCPLSPFVRLLEMQCSARA